MPPPMSRRLSISTRWRIALVGTFVVSFNIVDPAQATSLEASAAPDVDEGAAGPENIEEAGGPHRGDLSDAGAESPAASKPSFSIVEVEASAHERKGHYPEALAEWERLADLEEELTETQRATWTEAEARLTALTRGRIGDEPASTQRELLDYRRSGAERPNPTPLDTREPTTERASNRLVSQWYFWVAVSMIAVSVGTIAGLAIQSATNPGGVDGRAGAPLVDSSSAGVRF